MSAVSHIFSTALRRSNSAGMPISKVMGDDAVIYQKIRPNIKLVSTKETLPTAKLYDAVGDASLALRTGPIGMGEMLGKPLENVGASAVGLTSVLGCVVGVARARDAYRQMRDHQRIGDMDGAKLARMQIVENAFVVGGSAGLAVVRAFGIVHEVCKLLGHPMVLSPTMSTVHTVAIWASVALFAIFYLVFTLRQVFGLIDLSKGNDLRDKLLTSSNPMEELRHHIDVQMFQGSGFTDDECTEMALQEGAKLLEKLEKEVENVPWEPTDESRRDHAMVLFINNPEFMMAEMGKPEEFDQLTPEGKLVRFGIYIGKKRLCAKITNDLTRQLGPEAMAAFNKEKPNPIAFVNALKSVGEVQRKTVLKIVLAVVCCAAMIAGTALTGGLALAIPLLVLGLAGILWIVFFDGPSFLSQWASGDMRKRDKYLVGLSAVLSVIALGTLIALAVLSGGAPFLIIGAIFALTWLIINAYACYQITHPWKYQKQVTVETFRNFLETNPLEKDLEKIWNKLSEEDQGKIGLKMMDKLTCFQAVQAWEKQLKEEREEQLEFVMERLEEASQVVQRMPKIVAN